MRTTLLCLLCFAAIFTACENDSDGNGRYAMEIDTAGFPDGIDKIEITGIWLDAFYRPYYETIARGKVSGNTSTVYFDNPLPSRFLCRIEEAADFLEATFSDPDVLCSADFFSIEAYTNGRFIGSLLQSEITYGEDSTEPEKTHRSIHYIYTTQDVNVTGKFTTDGYMYKSYDLHLTKGWNRYMLIQRISTDFSEYPQFEYTSSIPNGSFGWHFMIGGKQ